MPIVQIHLMENRTDDQKRRLVKQVTEAICEAISVKPQNVRIILTEMAPRNYAIGGMLVADQNDPFGNKPSGP